MDVGGRLPSAQGGARDAESRADDEFEAGMILGPSDSKAPDSVMDVENEGEQPLNVQAEVVAEPTRGVMTTSRKRGAAKLLNIGGCDVCGNIITEAEKSDDSVVIECSKKGCETHWYTGVEKVDMRNVWGSRAELQAKKERIERDCIIEMSGIA
ncbi:hypothetical protein B0H17DRAFT_1148881 [Mycena rosella]|uniref:Uncharacterized protein n=1 Tax=Mycena rosella TaxID=1033263 RepID=A0AAD7C6H7_MYCRO|nr:hypothetical protein B0H17DRAFT_1148881 [Mycena rosella]